MHEQRYDSSSSDGSDSESVSLTNPAVMDFSSSWLSSEGFINIIEHSSETVKKQIIEADSVNLAHNSLQSLPIHIVQFYNLKELDLSNNLISSLPDEIAQLPLISLIVKNNRLSNDGIPKCLAKLSRLKVCNLSGNRLSHFPKQVLVLCNLEYLYLGNNTIAKVPRAIDILKKLKILCLGGNRLTGVPDSVGDLMNLQGLILSDNCLETLPPSIANLKHLRSLLLHKNRLRTLPTEIITLKCLSELSLRENPLVMNFVSDMLHNPPSLLELAGRTIKLYNIEIPDAELPLMLRQYLENAHRCVNPKCKGNK